MFRIIVELVCSFQKRNYSTVIINGSGTSDHLVPFYHHMFPTKVSRGGGIGLYVQRPLQDPVKA